MPNIFKTLRVRLWTWVTCEAGQGLTEYALIVTLIMLVAIVAVSLIGGEASSPIRHAGNAI
jgi:Flp pilus assembly pilin Flp